MSSFQDGRDIAAARRKFQQQLLSQPELKRALAVHIYNLNLQAQINKNPEQMNEQRAFEIIQREMRRCERELQTKTQESFPPDTLNQEDLQTPLNMENALNNDPKSYASLQMNAIAGALQDSLNLEETNRQQAAQTESENMEQQTQQQEQMQMQMQMQPTPGYESNDDEEAEKVASLAVVGEAAKEAIEAIARNDTAGEVKAITDITEKVTGGKVDVATFSKEAEEKEASQPFSKTPTPSSDTNT
ncbi:MAG: hypothetical protein COY58_06525 [Gammaproteobacteria bacterium CG_4_10_14_0_8_um_filter_38_16]|nr:MAG: hypothetical protein COY58_06525 [Gammaproteobacteria bacterium CG_4_10_14_0_8_um_filter_38_16]PJA02645.1 MAG: hypothetical protein COX72_09365 [Gammaproteobacteria bacterium CG_4_10_14_0_2_um_filter_38_22]PJB11101.1 MAG: hypothetical protein CO120_01515 [Gammaproteobacteria bacterium CG_4_9_14_3_um_filter_38_9]